MALQLTSILGNSQRLDGGAMFGNAPRAVWERWIPVDERHRIPLACRCLLVESGDQTVLLEAGIGAFFEPKLRDRFGVVEERHVLIENLAAIGVSPDDIDIVVLSHLHFDHAGGLLTPWQPDTPPELVFPRARYVIGERAWQRANAPHPRDRASFIPALQELLKATGRVELVAGRHSETLGEGWSFRTSDGHTPGMLLTELATATGPLVFAADLIPGQPWVHLPITMGYDRFPERLIDEKHALLDDLLDRGGRLFYTHDHECAASRVTRDERGRYRPVEPVAELQREAAS